MKATRTLAALLALLVLACGELASLPTEPEPPPGDTPDPSATFTRVQQQIFTPSCAFAGCHGEINTQEQLLLVPGQSFSNVVNRPSVQSQLDRIEPGAPDSSYLFLKVTGSPFITGDRMPLGGPNLSVEQITLLRDWIRRGAPND